MTAKKLIKETVPPLRPSDTGRKALLWMSEFHVQHLPIVDGRDYVGVISEYDILDMLNPDMTLHEYRVEKEELNRPFVREYNHIYEVVKVINENRLSIIPVLDEEGSYEGLITLENLLEYFAHSNAMQDPGGIIILEMGLNDYSLAQIAQIVESNEARILSMYISSNEEQGSLEVTLKVNHSELRPIIQAFERYDYFVKAFYQEEAYLEDMKERLDAFMNYLSI